MKNRKLLIVVSFFHATVNILYLVRFFGVLPPEEIVHGYIPWFMSFALPNATFTLLSWFLVFLLLKKYDTVALLVGLLNAGGWIFHALIGLMFGFYSRLWDTLTFGTIFEIAAYVYGLSIATVYIAVFWKYIKEVSVKC